MKETSGTVVFNSAGGFIPKLAQVCLAAVTAFDLPCALNMYLTNPGQKTSAPPHTDKQVLFSPSLSFYYSFDHLSETILTEMVPVVLSLLLLGCVRYSNTGTKTLESIFPSTTITDA